MTADGASPPMEMIVNSEAVRLEDALDSINRGTLRVPRFQQPFAWRPEQMLELFDSIERGYPIGSLLVWETNLPLASLGTVGDITVSYPPSGIPVSFVLDGYQRLATLFGTLMRPVTAPRTAEQQSWMWWVYRELGGGQPSRLLFRHWTRAEPPPAHYLPIRSVLRTLDFLAFVRELQATEGTGSDSDRIVELVDEAERVAQRIKLYRLAVIRLQGGSLEQAAEVFSRLNSPGRAMTVDQMLSALSHHEGTE
jgi:hypothetical protein